jgi:hypothetical protein
LHGPVPTGNRSAGSVREVDISIGCQIADYNQSCRNSQARLQGSAELQSANRLDQLQPRLYCPLSVILMRLRIAEIDQHAVAHVLRYEPAEALHSLGNALLIGGVTSRRSSGSIRADSAVEPTRSENITVTCRRSAASCAFGVEYGGKWLRRSGTYLTRALT